MDLSDVEKFKERERMQKAILSVTKTFLRSGEISNKVARSYLNAVRLPKEVIDNLLGE